MGFKVIGTYLNGIVVVKGDIYRDERGFFTEVYRNDIFKSLGVASDFVQDNHSRSAKNVVRGLHFQFNPPMGKLIRATVGKIFLAAVDIRKGSPTLGKWYGQELEAGDGIQVWEPKGFANGFCALSEWAEIQYKCTAVYNPKGESAIFWRDSDIGINWPLKDGLLSPKDANAQLLSEWLKKPESDVFQYIQEGKI
jgi:dTDP-4-dehydrorhamnose 3,5-epimerase